MEQDTKRIQFVSLGSGSCGNCYYLSYGADALFIDAGVGIRRLKKFVREYGLRTDGLRGLLITHDHADHIKAAAYVAAEYNINVYTTATIHEGMRHNYHAMRKVERHRDVDIELDSPFQMGALTVTAFEIPHDSTANVGYCIRTENGETFCIMTDVGAPTENVRKHVAESNYLVIEANYDREMLKNGNYPEHLKMRIASGTGHLCNDQTAQVLADEFHEGLRNVWLCHLSEENNHPELARKTVEFKLRQYGIIAGTDFQLEVLRRATPTGPWLLGKKTTLLQPEQELFAEEKQGAKVALFDLDGTIFDTEPQYTQFWGEIGRRYCSDIPNFEHIIKGTTLTQILDRYFPDAAIREQLVKELNEWEAQMYYPFVAGAEDFIRTLRQRGIKTAVVTSSNDKKMENVLRCVPQLNELFDRILTAEHFKASKPDPDCYLLGAQAFGVTPEECIVFEDAFTGIEAGMRAGMFTVGLTTGNPRSAIEDKCSMVVDDFCAPQLLELFN